MKKFLVGMLSMPLMILSLCVCVRAAENYYYTGFSDAAAARWTFNGASVSDGVLEVPQNITDNNTLYLQSPYPTGTVEVEYDFKASGQRAAIYIQNPNGGSVCRLQLNATTTLQLQHGNDAGTANTTTVLTTALEQNTWYHVRHVITYRTGAGEKTTSSVYVYNTSGDLLWYTEDKVYMLAYEGGINPNPTELRTVIVQNPGTSGSYYLDNFAVFEQTVESVFAVNKAALSIPGVVHGGDEIPLKSIGCGGATITWSSSDTSVISNTGVVADVDSSSNVTLTATIEYGAGTTTKDFVITVDASSTAFGNVYAFNFNDNTLPSGLAIKNMTGFNGVNNKRLELPTLTSPYPEIDFNFTNMAYGAFGGKIVVEFDYVSTSDKGNLAYFQAAPNGGSLVRIEQTGSAAARVVTGGAGATAVNTNTSIIFAQGTTYHAKVELDYDNRLCSVYIDGTAVALNHHFMTSTSPGALNVLLVQNNAVSGTGTVAIDNFVLYQNNYSGAVLATGGILDIDDKAAITSDITLPSTGYNGAAISWSSSDTDIISDAGVLVDVPLFDTEVTMTATITKGAKVLTKDITVNVCGSVVFTPETVGDNAVLNISNPDAGSFSCSFITSVFDSSGRFVKANHGSKSVSSVSDSLTIAMPDKGGAASGTIKYFVWNNLDDMIPLTEYMSESF